MRTKGGWAGGDDWNVPLYAFSDLINRIVSPSSDIPPTFHPAVSHARLCILRSSFRHHEGNRAPLGSVSPTTSSISGSVSSIRSTSPGCAAR
jgi:hypothetical protein